MGFIKPFFSVAHCFEPCSRSGRELWPAERTKTCAANPFGFSKGDILLQVGAWDVSDYSSAINAFYYLIPNQEVKFKILRGLEVKTMKVTPVSHPSS